MVEVPTTATPLPIAKSDEDEDRQRVKRQAIAGAVLGILVLLLIWLFWNELPNRGSTAGMGVAGSSSGEAGDGSGTSENDGESKSSQSPSGTGASANTPDTASAPSDQQASSGANPQDAAGSGVASGSGESDANMPIDDNSSSGSGADSGTPQTVDDSEVSDDVASLNASNSRQTEMLVPGDPMSRFTIAAPGEASFFGLQASGRRFAFVVDRSGSMAGPRLERAKEELIQSLRALRPHIEVLVVFFSDSADPFPGGHVTASQAGIKKLESWVEYMGVGGSTNVKAGMQHALGQDWKPDAVFLLTDGEFEHDTPSFVRRLNTDSSVCVNTVSLVSRAGEALLKQIARQNNGDYRHVP